MPIHLHETVDVVAGKLGEYFAGLNEMFAPLGEERGITMSGVFEIAGTSGRWPQAVLLWQIDSWDAYARQRTTAGAHPGVGRWHTAAVGWRTGGYDRMLSPLPFSPLPPARPHAASPGCVCVQQTFIVKPGHSAGFLNGMRDVVIAPLIGSALTLQAFWRSSFRPLEFLALWSVPDWDAFARLEDAARASGSVPGVDAVTAELGHIEERVLIPASFSPIGGTAA